MAIYEEDFTVGIRSGPIDLYIGSGGNTATMQPITSDGPVFVVKNAGSGILTLDASGDEQFFDTATVDSIDLDIGDSVTVVSINMMWQVTVIRGGGPDINVSPFELNGLQWNIENTFGNFTVDNDGAGTTGFVRYAGSGGHTVTMIDAGSNAGRQIIVKNSGSGSLTMDATGLGQFFNTALTDTLTLMIGDSITVIAAGGAWQVL